MTTKEKIKKFLEYKGISKNKFYTITGLSTTFLDSGNTMGVDKAKIIIEKFPEISLEWLVLDEGEMLKASSENFVYDTIMKAGEAVGNKVEEIFIANQHLTATNEKLADTNAKLVARNDQLVQQVLELSNKLGMANFPSGMPKPVTQPQHQHIAPIAEMPELSEPTEVPAP